MTRSLVLWIPDWPVVAAVHEGIVVEDDPVAIVEKNAVVACSEAARAEGVRRGQRKRDAQARCPRLAVHPADAVRDSRVFFPLVTALEDSAPGVQILRAGLCVLRVRGPARYYGGEKEAAEVLRAALRERGMTDVRAGIADGVFAAEHAARATSAEEPLLVVERGASAGFLGPLPVSVLNDEEIVTLLGRLGVQRLAEFAALDETRVAERLGPRGQWLHALAAGNDARAVQPRTPPPELEREVVFEPPIETADQVAFGMRQAAAQFITGLGSHELVCTELRVELTGDRGEHSERVWLHPTAFDAAAVVDRVRWQLSEDAQHLVSGVARVRVVPEAVDEASHHRSALFGSGPDERVHHALSRVQAMLGHRAVMMPAVAGGRTLAERQVLVPWGDRIVGGRERSRPWPGSLPGPLPTTVFTERAELQVHDGKGQQVQVSERGVLTAAPDVLIVKGRAKEVTSWAGPWPLLEREWDAVRARRAYRFQMVDEDEVAWVLVYTGTAWVAEARYD